MYIKRLLTIIQEPNNTNVAWWHKTAIIDNSTKIQLYYCLLIGGAMKSNPL